MSTRSHKRSSALVSFRSGGILDEKHRCDSEFEEDELPALRSMMGLGDDVLLHAPALGEYADAICPGWVALYEYPFTLGMKFPFPPLIQAFLLWFSLAPGQLAAQAWRVLYSICAVSERFGIDLRLADLASLYSCMPLGYGHVTMRASDGSNPFIDTSKGTDDGWFRRFVFVKVGSMTPPPEYLLEKWGETKGSAAPNMIDSLLSQKRKQPPSGTKKPPAKKEAKSPKIPAGFPYKTAPGPGLHPPGSSKAPVEVSDDGYTISLSPGFGYDASAPMWPDLDSFLLPGPLKSLEGRRTPFVAKGLCEAAFDTFQAALFTRRRIEALQSSNSSVLSRMEKLKAEVAELTKEKAEALEAAGEANRLKAAADQDLWKLDARITELEASEHQLKKTLTKVVVYAAWDSKIKSFKEFQAGGASSFDVAQEETNFLAEFPKPPNLSMLVGFVDSDDEGAAASADPAEEEVEVAEADGDAAVAAEEAPATDVSAGAPEEEV
ncbi:hypothetical protein RND81_08G068400 [Saponaria officinalis]|uniref:Uncharacterized protein n=1 Tax=Saponaria officinalis TaxID=3572 RepID=A0AAW1J4Y8_SAPOF